VAISRLQKRQRPFPVPIFPVAAVLLLLAASSGRAQTSPNVSLDHPSYRFLEHLDTLGLVDSRIAGIRPYTRLETARLLVEAEDVMTVRKERGSSLIRAWCELIHREFRAEAGRLLETDSGEGSNYFKPAQSVYARYVYFEGTETPEGDFGRVYNQGSQVFAGLTTHGTLFDLLAFHARPEASLHFHNWTGEEKDRYAVKPLETYAKAAFWNVELEGGLDALCWGQGSHDTLLLSNNAGNFPLLKMSNPMPVLLPWIFESLGPVRAQAFFTRLDRRRAVREPFLAGFKINLKPFPFLEIGAGRTFIFGGKDRPEPNVWDIFRGTEDNPDPGEPDLSNQLAGFDARVRLPLPIGGVSYYVEAVGEDEAGGFPYKWSFLHGLHLAGILPRKNLWLRVEWARTHEAAYVHGTYNTGYTYRLGYPGHTLTNSALGHHAGNDADDLYLEIGWFPYPGSEVVLLGDWEERRQRHASVYEEHFQLGASASHRFPLLGGLLVSLEYRYRRVRNAGFVRGETTRDSYVVFQVALQF